VLLQADAENAEPPVTYRWSHSAAPGVISTSSHLEVQPLPLSELQHYSCAVTSAIGLHPVPSILVRPVPPDVRQQDERDDASPVDVELRGCTCVVVCVRACMRARLCGTDASLFVIAFPLARAKQLPAAAFVLLWSPLANAARLTAAVPAASALSFSHSRRGRS
jgi:hypothetical protein